MPAPAPPLTPTLFWNLDEWKLVAFLFLHLYFACYFLIFRTTFYL